MTIQVAEPVCLCLYRWHCREGVKPTEFVQIYISKNGSLTFGLGM